MEKIEAQLIIGDPNFKVRCFILRCVTCLEEYY